MNDFSDLVNVFTDDELKEHDAEIRADERAELLDKFVARLKDYFVIPHDLQVIEQMANEMKGGAKCKE